MLVAYQDEASKLNVFCYASLYMIGAKRPFQREYSSSFVIAGYRGNPKPFWVEEKRSGYAKGPTKLNGFIPLLSSQKN